MIYKEFCLVSEPVTTTDNYMPMHSVTTGGQENIALLTLSSCEMDTDEGGTMREEKKYIMKFV